jgi:S1-C subfamily serine protease
VPAKDVQEVVRAVLKKEAGPAATTQPLGEDIVPGFLGIDVAAEAVTLDEGLGLGEVGALVVSVVPGSPAQAAGILPGDVITSFNQKPFRSPTELLKRIQSQRAGQNVVVSVVRGNQELELAARLGAQASGG